MTDSLLRAGSIDFDALVVPPPPGHLGPVLPNGNQPGSPARCAEGSRRWMDHHGRRNRGFRGGVRLVGRSRACRRRQLLHRRTRAHAARPRTPAGVSGADADPHLCGAVQAIVHAGLKPVLVDVDETTLAVSAEGVARAAKGGASAMVVQHMAGYPLPTDALAAAAGLDRHFVIEDAAHGLGAAVGTSPVGSTSQAACFSFYATKNLPLGEGGAVTTSDAELAERIRVARLHGMSRDAWRRYHRAGSWRYSVDEAGLKANFTDIQAAIGRAQLRRLATWQARRGAIAAHYDRFLAGVPGLELPPRPLDGLHAWHLYIVRVLPCFGLGRDDLIDALAQIGIGTSVHFIPVHHQPYFRRTLGPAACDGLPVADRVFPRLLSLPMFPGLADSDIERVCGALDALATR